MNINNIMDIQIESPFTMMSYVYHNPDKSELDGVEFKGHLDLKNVKLMTEYDLNTVCYGHTTAPAWAKEYAKEWELRVCKDIEEMPLEWDSVFYDHEQNAFLLQDDTDDYDLIGKIVPVLRLVDGAIQRCWNLYYWKKFPREGAEGQDE